MVAEHIIRIEDGPWSHTEPGSSWSSTYDGFTVVTNCQRIHLGVSTGQSCCERTGYFMSEDNLAEFIGAKLIGVTVTNTALRTYEAVEYLDEGGVMFVNLNTDRGTLQFAAYNSHNGYYGHEARVDCQQIHHSCGV
jgi:hypothetical protein